LTKYNSKIKKNTETGSSNSNAEISAEAVAGRCRIILVEPEPKLDADPAPAPALVSFMDRILKSGYLLFPFVYSMQQFTSHRILEEKIILTRMLLLFDLNRLVCSVYG
jgi:hypothetical protein